MLLLRLLLLLAPAALWRNWWTSNAVGMVLVLPLVVSFDGRPLQRLLAGRLWWRGYCNAAVKNKKLPIFGLF